MKRLLTGGSLVLVFALLAGCSDSADKKVTTSKPDAAATGNNPHGGMTPEQLAQMMTGEAGPGDATTENPHGNMTPEQLAQMMPGGAPPAAAPFDGTMSLGQLSMTPPKEWKSVPPRIGMIAYEFSIPKAEGDDQDGRMTVMGAGGSIPDNINRWIGQFTQPDGSNTADKAKSEDKEIAGHKVHLVDIPGTYGESMGGGPFAPGKVVERPNYRMLAAIVETANPNLSYFIKLYGPEKTVAANADGFRKMVEEMAAK